MNAEFLQSLRELDSRRLSRRQFMQMLGALGASAGVALVTPLKDGMNLVAKEFCAANLEGKGVLILSESTGAGAQLQDSALLVNPQDVEGVAAAIHRAVTMPPDERRRRMEAMRAQVRR